MECKTKQYLKPSLNNKKAGKRRTKNPQRIGAGGQIQNKQQVSRLKPNHNNYLHLMSMN